MATIERDRTYTPEDLRQLPDFERLKLADGRRANAGMGALAGWAAILGAPLQSDVPLS